MKRSTNLSIISGLAIIALISALVVVIYPRLLSNKGNANDSANNEINELINNVSKSNSNQNTTNSGATGNISYSSDRDGNYEIYSMEASGGNHKRLTNNNATDVEPSWSPDGTKIGFRSARDGNDEIYVMDASGEGQRNISNNIAADFEPNWD